MRRRGQRSWLKTTCTVIVAHLARQRKRPNMNSESRLKRIARDQLWNNSGRARQYRPWRSQGLDARTLTLQHYRKPGQASGTMGRSDLGAAAVAPGRLSASEANGLLVSGIGSLRDLSQVGCSYSLRSPVRCCSEPPNGTELRTSRHVSIAACVAIIEAMSAVERPSRPAHLWTRAKATLNAPNKTLARSVPRSACGGCRLAVMAFTNSIP